MFCVYEERTFLLQCGILLLNIPIPCSFPRGKEAAETIDYLGDPVDLNPVP
jgi:hypothetical protein